MGLYERVKKILLPFFCFFSGALLASTGVDFRTRALRSSDRVLTWALSSQIRTYQLTGDEKAFSVSSKDLIRFEEEGGYFSSKDPIVGMVTEDPADIEKTQQLLNEALKSIHQKEQLQFTTEEILAKVLAYRRLEKGMEFTLPLMGTYVVESVIDLWKGMPAYGLKPRGKGTPILLFRGTDLRFNKEKGWASILSDLDITGPGWTTFQRASEEIKEWLEKQKVKPRTIGYSLGGVFAIFTAIEFGDLLSEYAPSIAFNPPGISKDLLDQKSATSPLKIYVNKGDFVSQIGYLLPEAQLIKTKKDMGVIAAHTTLISVQPSFSLHKINIPAENKARY